MFDDTDNDSSSFGFRSSSDLGMFCLFVSLSLTGIIINVTFLYAAVKEKLYQKSRRNVYIMNLAIADLVIAIGCLFFPTLNYVVMDNNVFGQTSCKIFELFGNVVTPVSLLTLAVLSRERYRAISRVGKKESDPQSGQKKKTKLLVCCYLTGGNTLVLMWFFSLSTLIPISMFGRLENAPIGDLDSTDICIIRRYESLEPKPMILMRCTITYVIPILFIIYNYSMIAWKIFSFSSLMQRLRPSGGKECMSERVIKTTRRIFLLAFLIIITSGPCHYFLWVYYFQQEDVRLNNDFWDAWQVIGFYMFYLYPIINPVFFYFTSNKYKALFDHYLFRRAKRGGENSAGPECDEDEDDYVSIDSSENPETVPITRPAGHRNASRTVSSPA